MIFLNKKIIVGSILGLASIVTGGVQVARYLPLVPSEIVEEVPIMEESPVGAPQESVPETSQEAPEEPSASQTVIPPSTAPVTSNVSSGASTSLGSHSNDGYVASQYRFTSLKDAENAYMGTCPQDVPADVWSDPLQPAVALGFSSFGKGDSMKERITHLFNSYYTGFNGSWGDLHIFTIEQVGFNYGSSFKHGNYLSNKSWYYFEVDWDANTVTLKHEPGCEFYPSEEQMAELQAAAKEGSEHLAWLKSSFYAKCGSYQSPWL